MKKLMSYAPEPKHWLLAGVIGLILYTGYNFAQTPAPTQQTKASRKVMVETIVITTDSHKEVAKEVLEKRKEGYGCISNEFGNGYWVVIFERPLE